MRDRVRRAGVDLDLRPVQHERDLREERAVPQLGHGDALDRRVERVDDRAREVVRERPWRILALEAHQDRCRLGVANPDGEERPPFGRSEEDDRLLADEVEAHAVDRHLLHDPLLSVDTPLARHRAAAVASGRYRSLAAARPIAQR